MTMPPIVSITDELIAELERDFSELTDPLEFGDKMVRKAQSVLALIAERAELKRAARNRDMWKGQSESQAELLAEANKSYMAALHLLTSVRFASGDNGARMQTEFVEYIAELKRDAERYRWLRESMWYVGRDQFYCGEGGYMQNYTNENYDQENLDAAIDAAML